MTLLGSMLGENLRVPFELGGPNDSLLWFFLVVMFSGMMSAFLYMFGRRYDWF